METPFGDRGALGGHGRGQPRHEWDERHLARLARVQDGVVWLPQLTALGLSSDARATRLAQRRLIPCHRGVYAVGHDDLTERGRFRAAVCACGRGALLSHLAAARLLSLWERPVTRLEVTVPRPRQPRHEGIVVHRTGVLLPADESHVRGIPCTSVARTIVDLAGSTAPSVVEAVFERAERRRLIRPDAIEDLLRRRQRSPGVRVVRLLLETHRPKSRPTRSILERRLLAALRRAAVPEPVVNGRLDLGIVISPDLMWPRQRVLVELDGGETHGTRRAMRRDRGRDRRAILAGWIPLRFTWDDVDLDLGGVVADICGALDGR